MFRAIGFLIILWGLSHFFTNSFQALDGAASQTLQAVEAAAIVSKIEMEKIYSTLVIALCVFSLSFHADTLAIYMCVLVETFEESNIDDTCQKNVDRKNNISIRIFI